VALRDYLVGEIAEDHADGLLTRREALRRLALMGVSAPAAVALLAACGDDDDSAAASTTTTSTATSSSSSSTVTTFVKASEDTITFDGLTAAYGWPNDAPTAAVLVCHENRGLTDHFHTVAARFGHQGMAALCVDLASRAGGTSSMDEGQVQATLAAAPVEQLVSDLTMGIDELTRRHPRVPIATVGFCFGGAMVWNLLDTGDERIRAAVPFYGPAPEKPDFTGSRAAVLAIYGGKDDRVNATRDRAVAAMKAAGLTYDVITYDGADHAFFNDTGPRYDADAAAKAWTATLDWIRTHTT
jgi:carboxymethylenebutenolidase